MSIVKTNNFLWKVFFLIILIEKTRFKCITQLCSTDFRIKLKHIPERTSSTFLYSPSLTTRNLCYRILLYSWIWVCANGMHALLLCATYDNRMSLRILKLRESISYEWEKRGRDSSIIITSGTMSGNGNSTLKSFNKHKWSEMYSRGYGVIFDLLDL